MLTEADGLLDGLGDEGLIDDAILDTNGELEITGVLGLYVETIGEVITDDGNNILLLVDEETPDVEVLKDREGE